MKTALALVVTLLIAAILPLRGAGDDPPQADAPDVKTDAPDAAAAPLSDRPEEEKAIRAMVRAYTEAYNAGQVDDLVALVTEDATLEDTDGTVTAGREAIRGLFAESFADGPADRLEGALDGLRFFSDGVARAEGSFTLTPPDAEEPEQQGRFTLMAVREGDAWRVAEIRDTAEGPAAEPTPYERLAELEWMVGDWVDETEDAKVSSSVRWSEGRSFLVRTFSVEIAGEKASSGTMFLGWDPRSGQIKSWVFDSDGDIGEGFWTRVGPNEWMVKAQGVHHDGLVTSATQLHTLVNKDAVKSSSFDRIVGGEPLPAIDEVIMVRRAPAPADLPAASAEAPREPAEPGAAEPPATGAQAPGSQNESK